MIEFLLNGQNQFPSGGLLLPAIGPSSPNSRRVCAKERGGELKAFADWVQGLAESGGSSNPIGRLLAGSGVTSSRMASTRS